ncbi:hypothetical protein SSCG_01301 [Streptomyces clavuligerus]|nr:hypothetical protein SSCG_01301 [Streptomyces clavuligerus]
MRGAVRINNHLVPSSRLTALSGGTAEDRANRVYLLNCSLLIFIFLLTSQPSLRISYQRTLAD